MALMRSKKGKDGAPEGGDGDGAKAKGGRKKLVLVGAVVLVLGIAAATYFLLFAGGEKAKEPVKPEPGAVVHVEPFTINLAGGHFLKLGLGLQQTAAVAEELDSAKAVDLAISTFSNMPLDELTDVKDRNRVKKELTEEIAEAYEHEIYEIYFTEFVMQ